MENCTSWIHNHHCDAYPSILLLILSPPSSFFPHPTASKFRTSQVRDRHYDAGALLLGLGTFTAIEGPVNTFLRAQKLFPGPHLYAGAGIVVSWAVAAAMVPQMQKGNEAARIAHIAINFGMIGLFAWQVQSKKSAHARELHALPGFFFFKNMVKGTQGTSCLFPSFLGCFFCIATPHRLTHDAFPTCSYCFSVLPALPVFCLFVFFFSGKQIVSGIPIAQKVWEFTKFP